MKNNRFSFSVNTNAILDKGEGIVEFSKGLTITDNTEMWSGAKYDIKTMDISQYKGNLTANHSNDIEQVIGKTFGIKKVGNRVIVEGIEFAVKENPLARYAYNMLVAGFLTDFSVETMGPWPDEEGIFKNSILIGLSLVVLGNNKSATLNSEAVNEIAVNSLEQSKADGLDTSLIEDTILCYNKSDKIIKNSISNTMFVTVKNTRNFEVTVKFKNAAGDEAERKLEPGETVDVSEDQKQAVEALITNAVEPKKEIDVAAEIKNAVAPLLEQVKQMEQKIFDNSATEPKFKKGGDEKAKNELESTDWEQRTGKQINFAWESLKGGNVEASNALRQINEFHMEKLKESGVVKNSVTIGDFGNFVISPELLTEIQGFRSDYAPFLAATEWKETLSTQMAWLSRSGDINMQPVDMCDDGANGNLKPISDYGATMKTADLEELAAVTPVCNSATRFLAVDLLGDVAQGYRTDYDRKRAQLVIARMQQAVDETGNKYAYTLTSDLAGLKSLISAIKPLAEKTINGSFVMNYSSYWELVSRTLGAGAASPLFGILTTGDQPTFFGKKLVIVPDDLMPGLNTAGTKSFVVNGVTVTVNQGLFYGDLRQFTGRTSGGLQYDLSTEAAYEESGTVKSAYQRNELVLRGSFFRGGAIKDVSRFAGLGAAGIS